MAPTVPYIQTTPVCGHFGERVGVLSAGRLPSSSRPGARHSPGPKGASRHSRQVATLWFCHQVATVAAEICDTVRKVKLGGGDGSGQCEPRVLYLINSTIPLRVFQMLAKWLLNGCLLEMHPMEGKERVGDR